MSKSILAKTQRFGVLKQGAAGKTWNSVGTVSSNYNTILNNAKVSLPDHAVSVGEFDYTSSTGLMKEANRLYVDGISELKKIPFSGFVYKEMIADELVHIFQKVTEYNTYDENATTHMGEYDVTVESYTGLAVGQTISIEGATFNGGTDTTATITVITTGTNTITLDTVVDQDLTGADMTVVDCPKEFTFNNNIIDFASDEGYLRTIAIQNYNGSSTGDGSKLDNALLDSYTLSINNNGSNIDGLLKREGVWVGNILTPALDFTGNWVAPTANPTYYMGFRLDLTIGVTTYANACWKMFSFKYDRNITKQCSNNGVATNYLTNPSVEVTIDIPKTSGNYDLDKKYKEGDNVSFNFYHLVSGTYNTYVNGGIGFTSTSGILKSAPAQYDGDYEAWRLVIDVTRPNGGFYPNIVLADGIVGGY